MDIPLAGITAAFWAGTAISALAAVIKSGSSVRENITGILTYAFFILTWVPILVSCFFRRKVEWTPIKHV